MTPPPSVIAGLVALASAWVIVTAVLVGTLLRAVVRSVGQRAYVEALIAAGLLAIMSIAAWLVLGLISHAADAVGAFA